MFLCGSLEPGRDGVGDYTKKLAVELVRIGHEVELIAFMDKFICASTTRFEEEGSVRVRTSRLPFNNGYKSNCRDAKILINSFKPDWISLQYVPFSFHNKGLHFSLNDRLSQLGAGIKWHIMFHELWIGRDKKISVKKNLLSYLQQQLIKRLLFKLKPVVIHTHLPVYQSKLNQFGVKVLPLPLFSNIKVANKNRNNGLNKSFRFSFFSQVAASKQIINFINNISEQVIKWGGIPELILIGGSEKSMEAFLTCFRQECPLLKKVSCTGFLDDVAVSFALSNADIGITPVPRHALGKSGTVAAFLTHGIPVGAPVYLDGFPRNNIGFFDEILSSAILVEDNFELVGQAVENAKIAGSILSLNSIGTKFLFDLTNKRVQ